MMGNIHNKCYLHDYIKTVEKAFTEEVDKLEINDSTEINVLTEKLKAKYIIKPVVLGKPQPSAPKETKLERITPFGQTYMQKVFQINVSIPFEGRRDLFDCAPSTGYNIYLDENVKINNKFVEAVIFLEELDENKYNSSIEKIINDLSANIPTVNLEIEPWNRSLDDRIRQLIEERRRISSKKSEFMEKIGLTVNPKSNQYMIPPQIIKKIIPKPVTDSTKDVKKEVIPILQEDVYQDIKEVIYNVGRAIERKPSLYFEKHEEDLRDIFLLFLETRYESTSGVGEAFNKKGKTDILLKYSKDGTNLFVAECKFWRGQKKFHEALSQLLGYLTHRDSKTALIVFVNQKEFISIITTIKNEIINHPNYKQHLEDSYESSLSYEFTLPDDSNKIIKIEIMVFHFPEQ